MYYLDRFVILGNHRDAWVFGGVDPNSGTAAMMELARALSELRKIGMMYMYMYVTTDISYTYTCTCTCTHNISTYV
jgi:Zn-dependent M28 family amino/carboxypeptidase